MGFLPITKYKNNERTVSGSVNVDNSDMLLNVDTSLVPCTINLQQIPSDYWSTLYKLYIKDISGNASVNNITIIAPIGYKINNSSSVIINANGGCFLIRISSNIDYVAQYSNIIFGGGGYNLIEDETVPLTPRTTMNFTGGGVLAIDDAINNRTNVIINGGIISLTNAQMLVLINTSAVIAGQFYIITDADLTDGGLVVQGLEINNLTTLQGSGLFLNADYQNVGDYSGVSGYAGWKNIWTIQNPPSIVVGDVVIWNNLHYVNLTGVYYDGLNAPDTDTVNWQVLAKTRTNGYIVAVDFCKYNVINNRLIYRADNRINEVDRFVDRKNRNSLVVFQWGRNKVVRNKVRANSIMACTNSYPNFDGNILDNGSIEDTTGNVECQGYYFNRISSNSLISIKTCSSLVTNNELMNESTIVIDSSGFGTQIVSNNLSGGSYINVTTFGITLIKYNTLISLSGIIGVDSTNNNILRNYLSNNGNLKFGTISNNINGCEVSDIVVDLANLPNSVVNRKVRKGYSNWETVLDFTDVSIWNGTDLTIPTIYNYIGIFTVENANPLTPIFKIINMPTNHNCIFIPTDTQQCGFQHTLVGSSVANDLLCDAPSSLNVITGRTNGTDFIEYKKSGTKNIRTNLVLLA